ncbi:MAG: hypothetical protein K8F91_12810, partial [Candidatus Obscuribacterales bacterium]|nr:hypothetical protein [Candidatus Obscuribacterales bacterium]
KWASAIYQDFSADTSVYINDFDLALAVENCAETIKSRMGSLSLDLVVVFVSPHYYEQYRRLPGLIEDKLANNAFLGCSAGGLIGDGQEIELISQTRPCLSITAAHMSGVEIKPFYVKDEMLPDPDAPQGEWEALIGLETDSKKIPMAMTGLPLS